MRLLEAIIDANHRALAGDTNAGLHPAEFADALPLVALTCIDVRLNSILPQVLGVPQEQFIWLRNAGNIITGPQSSTMRSLSLACAVKGGKEIAIIGHTDCQVGKTTTMQLLEKLRAIGVERHMLPDNLTEFFGMFGSDRQNVIKAADIARQSPLIGPKIPIHGLLVDIETGKLDWLVNGYQAAETMTTRWNEFVQSAGQTVDKLKSLSDFNIGEMKFPETKIGETVTNAESWVSQKVNSLQMKPAETAQEATEKSASVPPKIPLPPPIRPRVHVRRAPK
jgi:carbonic anhydrase